MECQVYLQNIATIRQFCFRNEFERKHIRFIAFGAIWHLLTITAISSKTLEVTRYGADHKQHHFQYFRFMDILFLSGSQKMLIKKGQLKHYSFNEIRREKNDVFFSAASCKKTIVFGGHLFSFSVLLISLELQLHICGQVKYCQVYLDIKSQIRSLTVNLGP